jgi:hypothetical protein
MSQGLSLGHGRTPVEVGPSRLSMVVGPDGGKTSWQPRRLPRAREVPTDSQGFVALLRGRRRGPRAVRRRRRPVGALGALGPRAAAGVGARDEEASSRGREASPAQEDASKPNARDSRRPGFTSTSRSRAETAGSGPPGIPHCRPGSSLGRTGLRTSESHPSRPHSRSSAGRRRDRPSSRAGHSAGASGKNLDNRPTSTAPRREGRNHHPARATRRLCGREADRRHEKHAAPVARSTRAPERRREANPALDDDRHGAHCEIAQSGRASGTHRRSNRLLEGPGKLDAAPARHRAVSRLICACRGGRVAGGYSLTAPRGEL